MSAPAFANDTLLLQAFAAGDTRAFEQVFRNWYARLVLFSERYHAVRTEAEEIASEAFVKAWQSRTSFAALPKLKSFLYTVVRNGSLDAARRAQSRPPQVDFNDAADLPSEGEQAEMLKAEVVGALYSAIQTLPDRPREIVLMAYRDGLSYTEIAEHLQITESTVRTHKQRALELLRTALEGKFPGLAVSLAALLEQLFFRR